MNITTAAVEGMHLYSTVMGRLEVDTLEQAASSFGAGCRVDYERKVATARELCPFDFDN